ncbi:hypothetical protein BLOT_003502 [Blomia tropicalis]|nr:hypothetical protein BLOT_003502 [Blomia tropicalis]
MLDDNRWMSTNEANGDNRLAGTWLYTTTCHDTSVLWSVDIDVIPEVDSVGQQWLQHLSMINDMKLIDYINNSFPSFAFKFMLCYVAVLLFFSTNENKN